MASLSLLLPSSVNLRAAKRIHPMATSGSSTGQRAPASSSEAKPQPWWAPLFRVVLRDKAGPREPVEGKSAGTRWSRLMTEKVRVLRKEMRATESWHDAMYHSAVATWLTLLEDHPP